MEPPGSGVAIVQQEDAAEQGVAELEASADETDAETPSAEPAAAEVEPAFAPVVPAVEATIFEPDGVPAGFRALVDEYYRTLTVNWESATRAADRAGTVTGRITDTQTGEPVSAVQVYISSLQLGGLSQEDGRYLLQNVPAGTYTLAMTRIGYRTLETEITVTGGETALTATLESATRVADRGTVTGQITDAETGEAVPAVQVYISSLQLGSLTQRNPV